MRSYLYVQTSSALLRLDIDRLKGGERPNFDVVEQISDRTKSYASKIMIVDFRFYYISNVRPKVWSDVCNGSSVLGSDPITCLPSPPTPFGTCEITPRIMAKIEDTILVLERNPNPRRFGCFEEYKFPDGGCRILPPPPFSDYSSLEKDVYYIESYYSWGHRLAIFTKAGGDYVYDASDDTWTKVNVPGGCNLPKLSCAVEFGGFLVGKPFRGSILASFELDSNGLPRIQSNRMLVELEHIFSFRLNENNCSSGFVAPFGDGSHLCFIYSGWDDSDRNWRARVAVFEISISRCDGMLVLIPGSPLVHEYNFDYFRSDNANIYSTFIGKPIIFYFPFKS